jgi:hypothetical protein
MRLWNALLVLVVAAAVAPAYAQRGVDPAPSTYDPQRPAPLVVDLHGLNITPLQQILFDGTQM